MRGYEVILTVIQGGMIRDDAWLHDGDWICIFVVALLRMGRCRDITAPAYPEGNLSKALRASIVCCNRSWSIGQSLPYIPSRQRDFAVAVLCGTLLWSSTADSTRPHVHVVKWSLDEDAARGSEAPRINWPKPENRTTS